MSSTQTTTQSILIGKAEEQPVSLLLSMANRHGIIAGATGTGKTISLKAVAEQFLDNGVNVFLVDVKGDLSGFSKVGQPNEKLQKRLDELGITNHPYKNYATNYWDVFGKLGLPLRTTVSEIGPILLSRLLDLNATQSSILEVAFQLTDKQGLLLLDLKDLKAQLNYLADNAKALSEDYGSFSTTSVNTIIRNVSALESQGANQFFGEPALDLKHLINGNGEIHVLAGQELLQSPKLYASTLLWLLSELYENLPEAGDLPQPKIVLFFDEAHLLFEDAPEVLTDKIEQVVRLIRSKGVGVYFITQNPLDIPESIRGQLGNRIQHALRVFSPKDEKAVKSLANSFSENPNLPELNEVITQLGVGEAIVSCLDAQGMPTQVQKTKVCPPKSQITPIDDSERQTFVKNSPYYNQYSQAVDRESAYEVLSQKAKEAKTETAKTKPVATQRRQSASQDPLQLFMKSATQSLGRQITRELVRGIMGALK